VHKFSKKLRTYLKILGVRKVACSTFRTEDPQTSGATVQSLVATRYGAPDFCVIVLGLFDGALAFLGNILLRVFVIVISLNYLSDVCVYV
jgi:sugar (pentulose or hexulose) kinase